MYAVTRPMSGRAYPPHPRGGHIEAIRHSAHLILKRAIRLIQEAATLKPYSADSIIGVLDNTIRLIQEAATLKPADSARCAARIRPIRLIQEAATLKLFTAALFGFVNQPIRLIQEAATLKRLGKTPMQLEWARSIRLIQEAATLKPEQLDRRHAAHRRYPPHPRGGHIEAYPPLPVLTRTVGLSASSKRRPH